MLRTGIDGELAVFDEAFMIPIGVQGRIGVNRTWSVELGAGFSNLLGPLQDVRPRHAWLAVDAAWP